MGVSAPATLVYNATFVLTNAILLEQNSIPILETLRSVLPIVPSQKRKKMGKEGNADALSQDFAKIRV